MPALTFVATATAVVRAGLVPVVADVDPQSWLLTPAIARAACAELEIAAVLPVATFGCPHDMAQWDRFSADTGLPVVIDAAGAFGNQWQTGKATLVFSLHATKSWPRPKADSWSVGTPAGRPRTPMCNFGINLDPQAGVPVGQVDEPGTNAKLSEYHAAIGVGGLAQWPVLARRRIDCSGAIAGCWTAWRG